MRVRPAPPPVPHRRPDAHPRSGVSVAKAAFFGASFLLLSSMGGCHTRSSDPASQATASATSAAASAPALSPAATGPHVVLPDGFSVFVEVAADDSTREQGLMFRDRLPGDRGMIFLFPATNEYAFWMKNTLIPLDMIWIDEQRHVVHVAHDVPPCKADPCPSYPPKALARYVLELQAGAASKHRVIEGAALQFTGLESISPR
jgi:uncharacterized membrane protein (UPF0127 family)